MRLTLKEAADAMDVSESLISRYESKEIKNMGIDKIKPLAKILKITLAYLMGWDEKDKDFIIYNELAYIILHDKVSRAFANNIKSYGIEAEANIFVCLMTERNYNDYETISHIQTIINTIYCDYVRNSFEFNKYVSDNIDDYYIDYDEIDYSNLSEFPTDS